MTGFGIVLLMTMAGLEVSIAPGSMTIESGLAPTANTDRIHLARGEYESVQLHVEGRRKGGTIEWIETSPVSDSIPPPTVFRVGYPSEGNQTVLDRLFPFEPVTLEREQRAVFWLTYHVPREASPGAYTNTIILHPSRGPQKRVELKLTVFEFELPAVPTLRTLFELNRNAMHIDSTELPAWQTVYDALAPFPLSYSVWDGGALVSPDAPYAPDASQLKEHLDYVLTGSPMNTIDLGAGKLGATPFPVPDSAASQDPLQLYLLDMHSWLAERDALDRAVFQPVPTPGAEERQAWRDASFRIRRADKNITRLLSAEWVPFYDGYADAWAIPHRLYEPKAAQRMLAGIRLSGPFSPVKASMAASSSGTVPSVLDERLTHPEAAFDGSPFSFWASETTPSTDQPAWIELQFETPVQIDRLTLLWQHGFGASQIRARTSWDGRIFSTATCSWQHTFSLAMYEQGISEGTFRVKKTCKAIRLEFRNSEHETPIRLAEIVLNEPESPELTRDRPVEPWLIVEPGAFPGLRDSVHPLEARVLPWVCWAHGYEGVLGSTLVDAPGSPGLFYNDESGLSASLRAYRLRDGIEDYEYLTLLAKAVTDGVVPLEEAPELAHRVLFPSNMTERDTAQFAEQIPEARLTIGWLLSGTDVSLREP